MEWSELYSRAIGKTFDESSASPSFYQSIWTLPQLKEAFRVLGSQTSLHLKICFVIDGLDEFDGDDGDHDEMGQLFKEITGSNRIKVCLSSRPWVVFEDLFESCPNLKLQDLTYRDIEQYVRDKFNRNTAFLKLASREPAAAPALLKEIVEKADGVFLWVKLVVRSLLQGMRNRDDISDLSEQLHRLPREIKPLYNRLLQLIEPYERWASQAIQILRFNRELGNVSSEDGRGTALRVNSLTISGFALAMSETLHISSIENMTRKDFQFKCEDTRVRLIARCAGFLEVSNISRTSVMGPGSFIQYFHRTAKDFLESEEVWTKLLLWTAKTDFNPSISLMRSCLWSVKIQIAFSAEAAQNFVEYDVEAHEHIAAFMAYAFRADSHNESREVQTALSDQLSDLIAKYDTEGHWLYDLIPRQKGRCQLIELSTIWCLGGYVRDRLQMTHEWQRKAIATSLLQFALGEGLHDFEGKHFRSLEMLSILLDFGADPGNCSGGLSLHVQGVQQSLEQLRKSQATCPQLYKQYNLDRAQAFCTHIQDSLGVRHPIPAVAVVQSNGLKRLAEAIEDLEETAQPNKIRKLPMA